MKTKRASSVLHTLITILLVNLVLALIAWVVGWPVIDGMTLFYLGLATLILAYLLDASLFARSQFKANEGSYALEGAWRYRWRKYIYNSPPSSRRGTGVEQSEYPGKTPADPELERARRLSNLLINISLSGAIAAILSFILPRLFQ